MKRQRLGLKRAIDVCGAVSGLIVLSPVLLLIAVLVRLRLGSPALFRQPRLGLHGEEFTLIKFRTMTDARDAHGQPLPDSERLTSLGLFLRKTSLDELPELFNVLRGEMSLVGPRPLLVQYRDLYTPQQWRRHEVRPGIAGPVVIRGRNAMDWESKFEWDVWYVDNWSLRLDLRILLMTVWKALSQEGINQPGEATMKPFEGSKPTEESEPPPL